MSHGLLPTIVGENCVAGVNGSRKVQDTFKDVHGRRRKWAKKHESVIDRHAVVSIAYRVMPWFVLFAVLTVMGFSCLALHAQSASSFFKRGQSAEMREDYDTAWDNYRKAYSANPKDLHYRAALYRVQTSACSQHLVKGRKLIRAGDDEGALIELLRAEEIDPANEEVQKEIVQVRSLQGERLQRGKTSLGKLPGKQEKIDSMDSPTELKVVSNEPLTLHMVEDAKLIYQALGRAAGINVLFDQDYISKRIQVDLVNVSLTNALRIVGTESNTFWRPVTDDTIFVAQNTRAKRTELDEQAVETFYLSNAWQQNDLNDVQTALRNVLPNTKVYGVASQNAIVMRATPDELLLASKLVDDLDKSRPEVVVDLSILEVSKIWQRTLGIQWPQSVGVQLQSSSSTASNSSGSSGSGGSDSGGSGTTNLSLYDLNHLKASNFAVSIGAAQANMLLSDSNTKVLQNPQIRATDSQKATMKIGQRIPIATGSYQTGASTALVSSLVNTQFQYIDVGVNIEVTPTVHLDQDVTLKMKVEVSSTAGNVTISGVSEPVITQRTSEQVIRLREGEASILGGILNQQDTATWSGIPGLSWIPILKYLFGSKDHQINDDEIVFLVVPHVVRSQELTPANLRTIDTGVGQSIELRQIPANNQGSPPGPAPTIAPAGAVRHGVATVSSQTTEAAGLGALTQLRATADSVNGAVATHPSTSLSAGGLSFFLSSPTGPVVSNSIFQVPIVLNHGTDIGSVPLQIQYDSTKLLLISVETGDLLSRDGQAVTLIHRDDGSGALTINASRPPGANGVGGSGVVCVLSFQAKAAGKSDIAISRVKVITSRQQPISAEGARTSIVVR